MSGALIVDYLVQGLAASRPSAPDADPTTLSYYYASDTGVLSFYDWTAAAWINITAGSLKVIPAPTSAGSTLSVTAAMSNGDILLNTASGSVCTLPAATGSGNRFHFIVTVIPTSNSHQVNSHSSSDIMTGNVVAKSNIGVDLDFAELVSGADQLLWNGTTTGGAALGDWAEFRDIATNLWEVSGSIYKNSSSPATMFFVV